MLPCLTYCRSNKSSPPLPFPGAVLLTQGASGSLDFLPLILESWRFPPLSLHNHCDVGSVSSHSSSSWSTHTVLSVLSLLHPTSAVSPDVTERNVTHVSLKNEALLLLLLLTALKCKESRLRL